MSIVWVVLLLLLCLTLGIYLSITSVDELERKIGTAEATEVPPTLVYIRHGHRPAYSNNKEEIASWKKHPRYQENCYDEPLTEKGERESLATAQELLKIIDIDQYEYIYVSPFTRTMETAKIIIDEIARLTGRRLRLRVEYGLHETPCLSLNTNKTEGEGLIDKHLRWPALRQRYSDYIDPQYHSLIADSDTTFTTPEISIKKYQDTIKHIAAHDPHAIIVGHGGQAFSLAFRTLIKDPQTLDTATLRAVQHSAQANMLNFVAIFEKSDSTSLSYTLKFGPRRII
jgi:broad specificity phosphatase PhoE